MTSLKVDIGELAHSYSHLHLSPTSDMGAHTESSTKYQRKAIICDARNVRAGERNAMRVMSGRGAPLPYTKKNEWQAWGC